MTAPDGVMAAERRPSGGGPAMPGRQSGAKLETGAEVPWACQTVNRHQTLPNKVRSSVAKAGVIFHMRHCNYKQLSCTNYNDAASNYT